MHVTMLHSACCHACCHASTCCEQHHCFLCIQHRAICPQWDPNGNGCRSMKLQSMPIPSRPQWLPRRDARVCVAPALPSEQPAVVSLSLIADELVRAAAAVAAKRASASITTVFGDEPSAALLLGLHKPVPGEHTAQLHASRSRACTSLTQAMWSRQEQQQQQRGCCRRCCRVPVCPARLQVCVIGLLVLFIELVVSHVACSYDHDDASGSEAGSEPDAESPTARSAAAAAKEASAVSNPGALDAEVHPYSATPLPAAQLQLLAHCHCLCLHMCQPTGALPASCAESCCAGCQFHGRAGGQWPPAG